MATITETPEETLKSALAKVAEADDYIEQQHEALDMAQGQADATKGFTEAAQVDFNNLEAKYRVLLKRADSASAEEKSLREQEARVKGELKEAEQELKRVQNLQKEVDAVRSALDKVTADAGNWLAGARNAETELQTTETELEKQADSAPAAQKSALVNACRLVNAQRGKLSSELGPLGTRLAGVERKVKALPKITVSAEQDDVGKLKNELGEITVKLKAGRPAVSQSEIDKAKDARDNAERTLNDAPETERRAQAELRQAQTDLAEAQKRKATALTALESAENAFIAGIELSAPDNAGLVTATARLNRKIPKGYVLAWKAGAAKITPQTDEKVVIDTSTLPSGDTEIEARLEPSR